MSRLLHIAGHLLPLLTMLGARAARADAELSASAALSTDGQGYSLRSYQGEWAHEAAADGERLTVGWYQYGLGQSYAGVIPFNGQEASAALALHQLAGLWWFGEAVGFQGQPDRHGAVGQLVLARAIPLGPGSLTPRLEAAREPLALTPLPLSLGMASERGAALLDWRSADWLAEAGARAERWEPGTFPGRVRNGALDAIGETRVATVFGYFLGQAAAWLQTGLAAKAAWSDRNTLLPTELRPTWTYSWYPASAPPFLWETAVVVRAHSDPRAPLAASLQLQVPALSRETRQWEALRQSSWGTAPLEGRLQVSWTLSSTVLEAAATLFAKPWERWDFVGPGAYRQGSLQLALKQKI